MTQLCKSQGKPRNKSYSMINAFSESIPTDKIFKDLYKLMFGIELEHSKEKTS